MNDAVKAITQNTNLVNESSNETDSDMFFAGAK